jgi:hypothetical protein
MSARNARRRNWTRILVPAGAVVPVVGVGLGVALYYRERLARQAAGPPRPTGDASSDGKAQSVEDVLTHTS